MLTEKEVVRSWQVLFKSRDYGEQALDKAETLLEELRPESPLRHRLAQELSELRSQRQKQLAGR